MKRRYENPTELIWSLQIYGISPHQWTNLEATRLDNPRPRCVHLVLEVLFGLVSLFNSISTFVSYLMSKPSLQKNNSGTI